MKTIKGPGIFLAQFIGPQAPFNTLAGVAQGIQIHRVHDVEETRQGLALWRAVTGGDE